VNATNAINIGGLAGNSLFFGGATAEILTTSAYLGGWNGDRNNSIFYSLPWFMRGNASDAGAAGGVFAFSDYASAGGGGVVFQTSHRTILSGY
jgi:hypothetical protein